MSPDLLSQEVNGETILLHLSRYLYYGMNRAGSAVWRELARATDIETLARQICGEFAVDEATAVRDIALFLAELEDQGLIEAVSAPAAVSANAVPVVVAASRPYAPPRLEVGQLRKAANFYCGTGNDGLPTCFGGFYYSS